MLPEVLLLVALITAFLLLKSYSYYLSLGIGGFGQHPLGFVRAIATKVVLGVARVDLLNTKSLEASIKTGSIHAHGWLAEEDVPMRDGAREALGPFPVPQRHWAQLDYIRTTLPSLFPSKVAFGSSHIERIGPALFAHSSIPPYPHLVQTRREILHVHLAPFSFDCPACPTPPPASKIKTGVFEPYTPLYPPPAPQSLHVTLSAKDAMLVIERKWGVRHMAAGTPPWPLVGMPEGFVLVYAPRNEREEEVVRAICRASVGFATSDEHMEEMGK
ncbi:hypothetical protein RQP46_004185 [Phenoliferia psychrophenolica]